ncbi:MAG: glucosaminidase domain-containing protein [Bacteroidota bacterium]
MLKNQFSDWKPMLQNGLGKLKLLVKKEGFKLFVVFLVMAWAMQKDLRVEVNFSSPAENVSLVNQDIEPISLHSEKNTKKERYMDYIETHSALAVKQMKANRIPASIILAQGLLESDGGASKLAIDNKNHFGIKCFSRTCKKGHCANFNDDSHKDFFRIYGSINESYQAHSAFLKKDRYNHLRDLPVTDYISWAYGLKKAGYATDKKYAEKLISLINRYDLARFDRMA